MTDRELIYQVLQREITELLGMVNPNFTVFSNMVTKYVANFIDPYITAFTNSNGTLNTKAAEGFLKEETNKKIEEYMRKFEQSQDNKESK